VHVCVTVRREESQVRVQIQDDGAGFPSGRDKGLGIMGMEERVRHLGGTLRIESEPGKGATVAILLPLAQPAAVNV
jgi:signal transduction histidine kinase